MPDLRDDTEVVRPMPMTFLAPFAWSLLALAAPIIALYLIKTLRRRRRVSTLLFWEQLPATGHHRSLWRQLRRWVSLALQLLFLLLLVAALARPLASWQSARVDAVVLVMDPAPSMAATDVSPSRWGRALDDARRRVASLRPLDEAAVLTVGTPPTVLSPWTNSRRALGRALDGAPGPSAAAGGAGGIRETLALAKHLAAGRANGRVVLLSDGASWDEPPDAALLAGVEWETVGTPRPANTALTTFAARRSLAAPGDWTLAVALRRFGGDGPVSGELEILRDGRLLDLQNLTLDPAAPEPWRKTWRGHADGETTFEARLRFPNVTDALATDDHATARLEPVGTVDVALVAAPNGFLDAALGALPAVRRQRRSAGELAAATPAALTVFYRQAPPEGWTGNTLLVDPPGSGWWGEAGGELVNPLVSDVERESVPMRFVGLDNVSLGRAREFRPGAGASVFAGSFGKPLAFGRWPAAAGGGEGRRWLVLPFDLENGDFVLRTAFPVLLGNLVQSLRPADAPTVEPLPGAVGSRLVRTVAPPGERIPGAAATAGFSPLAWAPLWWWAALLGAGWLLGEWWLFSRRVTE